MARTCKTPTKKNLRSHRRRERPIPSPNPHSFLAELITAGYTPNLSVPGSYTPLEVLTYSNLPSDLSDLSRPPSSLPGTSSPHSDKAEPSSEEEVKLIVSCPGLGATMSRITRSQSRALQAQSASAPPGSSSPQPIIMSSTSTESQELSVPSSPTLSTPLNPSPAQTPPVLVFP